MLSPDVCLSEVISEFGVFFLLRVVSLSLTFCLMCLGNNLHALCILLLGCCVYLQNDVGKC